MMSTGQNRKVHRDMKRLYRKSRISKNVRNVYTRASTLRTFLEKAQLFP